MKKDWKQILGDILGTVFILAIGGGVTLFLLLSSYLTFTTSPSAVSPEGVKAGVGRLVSVFAVTLSL